VRARSALRGLLVAVALGSAPTPFAGARAQESGATYQARSLHVRDGDGLIVSDGERQRDLRVAEIDAPERGQAWSKRAAQALARLVEGQPLRVELIEIDRYGREVSNVWAGETCVACELVRGGHAWAYRKYLRSPALVDLERSARAGRRGLWSQPAHTFIPPWEWRRGVREVSPAAAALALLGPVDPAAVTAQSCGAKRYCREMASCAEARFYLEQCGLSRLDRDGDGVACEDLCR
jgi:endonuclease YncB( thermonuclease family)